MTSLSRNIRHGTIYTRIRDLMRAGVLKKEDRPLWYDVMKTFPPITPPYHDQVLPEEPVKDILYPEDVIRAQFYKEFGAHQTVNLNRQEAVRTSPCQRFIVRYQELEAAGKVNKDNLFEETVTSLAKDGFILRRQIKIYSPEEKQDDKDIDTKGLAFFFQEALKKSQQSEPKDS